VSTRKTSVSERNGCFGDVRSARWSGWHAQGSVRLFLLGQINRFAFSDLRSLEKTLELSAGTASPTAPAPLLEPNLEFPDQAPKLWLIASSSAMSSTYWDSAERTRIVSNKIWRRKAKRSRLPLQFAPMILDSAKENRAGSRSEVIGVFARPRKRMGRGLMLTSRSLSKRIATSDRRKRASEHLLVRGEIQYDCVAYSEGKGDLLFIKPMLNGSEPPDIRAYAASHKTFPHEATSNQF